MMDLVRFITNEFLYLKKEEAGSIIGLDQERFNAILNLAFSREMPVCWRSAWLMDYLSELHPWLAEKHIEKIWSEMPAGHPDGVTRSCLRLLCRYDIPEECQGIAADLCLSWLEQAAVPVAIKAYSMELLLKLVGLYPELANEFIAIIEAQAPNNSAGFKARAVAVVSKMRKLMKH